MPRAWREGGTGGDSSSETQPRELPYFLEGGTPNVLGIAGLAAGIRWVQEQGVERIHAHEMELIERLRRRLEEIDGVTVYGGRDAARRVSTLSFRAEALRRLILGGDPRFLLFDIAVRPGLHCAPYIHRALGTFPDGTVRVSAGPFNIAEDVDTLVEALAAILS